MKHVQVILGSILYGLYTDSFAREIIVNIICMYAALVIMYILQIIRNKTLVIPLLFITASGFSQKFEKNTAQLFVHYSYVASVAQMKIDKPLPIHMPYWDMYSDPTIGIQYRYSTNNSAAYASIGLQQICAGNRLMTFIPVPIPFRKTNFTRIKVGILAEVLIDWNPNNYKPFLNTENIEVKTSLSYVDNLLNKPLQKFNIPKYKETAPTYAYGLIFEYPMTFDNQFQIIPFINLKNYGKLDKLNIEGGIRMAMSYSKISSKVRRG